MVSNTKRIPTYGKARPCPVTCIPVEFPLATGQQMNPKFVIFATGYLHRDQRSRLRVVSRPPELPCFHLGYRKERDWLTKTAT
jgi:hypothetical protein